MAVDTLFQRDAASPSQQVPQTVSLLGLGFAALSESDTIEHVLNGVAEGRGGWLCPANLDVVRQWRESPEVRELVAQASLVVADGMPLIWASGVQGTRLPGRVAGSTLVVTLTAAAAAAGASVFLLGGNPGCADVAVERLAELTPDLRLAGTLCPPFGFERDPAWLSVIKERLREAAPDIIYVGLGFPKQERLIVELQAALPTAWFVSCGISFSFLSGEVHRAPEILQRLGLEWLHRLAQEPRRLYRRYLLQGIPFFMRLLSSSLVVRLRLAYPWAG